MRLTSPRFAVLLALCLAAGAGYGQYLEATIPAGLWPNEVLWNPTSNKVYVANLYSDDVTIIDGATNRVLATVGVGEYPGRLAWNSRDNKVYVSCIEGNRVGVIDGVGDTLIRVLRGMDTPGHMAYCATLNKVYVAAVNDYEVVVFDAGPDTVISTVRLYRQPEALVWVPTANVVFCTMGPSDTVGVIDCVTDRIIHKPVFPYAIRLLWNPVNNLVYATGAYKVAAFNAGGDSVVATVPAGGFSLHSMCLARNTNKLYVGDVGPGAITVIDCNRHTVLDTIHPLGYVHDLLYESHHNKVYVTSGDDVWVYDAAVDTLIARFQIGGAYMSLGWNEYDNRVYVADNRNAVYVLRDTSTGVAEQAAPTAREPIPGATLARGTFTLTGKEPADLVDIAGRAVALLKPGRNDLRRLAPGVYVVVGRGSLRTKVVLAGRS